MFYLISQKERQQVHGQKQLKTFREVMLLSIWIHRTYLGFLNEYNT